MDDPAQGPPADTDAARRFAEALERRGRAAEGLERDLLTEVPMLYGAPGMGHSDDPGIVLARLHREDILRRNRGGIADPSRPRRVPRLPFERSMIALAILLFTARFWNDLG